MKAKQEELRRDAVKFLLDNNCGDLILNLRHGQDKSEWIYASDIMEKFLQSQSQEVEQESVISRAIRKTPEEIKQAVKLVVDYLNLDDDKKEEIHQLSTPPQKEGLSADEFLKSIAKQIANYINMPYVWEDVMNRLLNGERLPFKLSTQPPQAKEGLTAEEFHNKNEINLLDDLGYAIALEKVFEFAEAYHKELTK